MGLSRTPRQLSLLVTFSCFITLTSHVWKVEALEPTGDWSICVTQGWESDCGYYNLYGAGSEADVVVNRVIGGPDLASGRWNCAADPVNKCRAEKTGSVTPTYYSTTTTSTTTTEVGGSTTTTQAASSTASTSPTTTAPNNVVNPCLDPANPNYACGWAILGEGNYVRGVIVCTFSVCGSGSFGGMRLALQAQQTPDGNVAGYSGGTYNESTQTFSLPGGGTLRSGDKLDEAVFPTTTTIADATTTTTINGGAVAETVNEVLASSGVLYKDPDSYVKGETQVAITESQIVLSLPPITSSRAEFVVTFDPDGPKPPRVIDEGTIIDGRIQREPQLRNTSDSPSAGLTSRDVLPMNWVNVNTSKSLPSGRLAVSVNSLEQESGVVSVTIVVAGSTYGKLAVQLQRPKKYLSCRMLLRDYPGGISAPGRVVDRNPGRRSSGQFKPTINLRIFTLNKALDSDGDRIACEPVGQQAKSSRP